MSALLFANQLLNTQGLEPKTCKVCGETFPARDYPRDKYIKGGISHRCAGCLHERVLYHRRKTAEYRANNRAATLEYGRNYSKNKLKVSARTPIT